MNNGWLTVPEVAREMGVSNQTVRNWIERDKLRAVRVVQRGVFRVPVAEVALLKERIGLYPAPPLGANLADLDRWYAGRIQPVLDAIAKVYPLRVLRRLCEEPALAAQFTTFPEQCVRYVTTLQALFAQRPSPATIAGPDESPAHEARRLA